MDPAIQAAVDALRQTSSPDLFADGAPVQPTAFGAGARQWPADKRSDSQPLP
jgi:hypothetical protein